MRNRQEMLIGNWDILLRPQPSFVQCIHCKVSSRVKRVRLRGCALCENPFQACKTVTTNNTEVFSILKACAKSSDGISLISLCRNIR